MSSEKQDIYPTNSDEYKELKADERAKRAAFIKAEEESIKLRFDTVKHLTTLSTGSLLLIVAFLEKLFSKPHWKTLVVFSFIGFIFSILFSLTTMFRISGYMSLTNIPEGSKEKETNFGYYFRSLVISVLLFIFGLITMALFALINFFSNPS